MMTGHQDNTTVATQALYWLNDPFVRRQSLNLAERLLQQGDLDDTGRIDLADRLTLGRSPNATESERTRGYLTEFEALASELIEATPEEASPKPNQVVAVAAAPKDTDSTAGTTAVVAQKTPPPPVNPDEVVQVEATIKEEVIRAKTRRPRPGPASAVVA